MKKLLVISFIFLVNSPNIYCKVGILSLNKAKQKIEKAFNNAVTLTKENIKDFFDINNKKKEDNIDIKNLNKKDPDYYLKLATQIEQQGNKFLQDKTLWCQQKEFINKLKETYNISAIEANLLLSNRIKEKYNKSNIQLIDFAHDIKNEENFLKEICDNIEILKDKKDCIKNDKLYLKLINLENPLNNLKNNLQNLISITNNLLTH